MKTYSNIFFIVNLFFFGFLNYINAQKYTEPENIKQFNITVNYDDYTVKTQILKNKKDIRLNNELTYLWYASQKIIETKGGYEGKLIHGNYTAFYLNNQLKEQGKIKYGLKHKEWKYWYPDGKLREIINWKNGVKNGTYILYNDYGQMMAKSNFKNNKLNGKFYTYTPDGKVLEKKIYKNGDEVVVIAKTPKAKKEKQEKINANTGNKPENSQDKPTKEKKTKKKKKTDTDLQEKTTS